MHSERCPSAFAADSALPTDLLTDCARSVALGTSNGRHACMHARPTPRRVAAMAKQRHGSLPFLWIPSCLACVLPAPCSRTAPLVAPQPGQGGPPGDGG